jgi:hypothetical protein
MPIKVEPFENPFKTHTKDNGDRVKIVTHNGKTYEQVVRKK